MNPIDEIFLGNTCCVKVAIPVEIAREAQRVFGAVAGFPNHRVRPALNVLRNWWIESDDYRIIGETRGTAIMGFDLEADPPWISVSANFVELTDEHFMMLKLRYDAQRRAHKVTT